MVKKKKGAKTNRRYLNPLFLWVLTAASAVFFYISFRHIAVFPARWRLYVLGGLALILVLSYALSRIGKRNRWVGYVNIGLCLSLALGALALPRYTDRVAALFNTLAPTKITIECVVMADDDEDIYAYENAVFITDTRTDGENMDYAAAVLAELYGHAITTLESGEIREGASLLYEGSGEILIMTADYRGILEETEEFADFADKTKVIYTIERTVSTALLTNDNSLAEGPFIIFFGGNDQSGELSLYGRSDVDMVVAVNPLTGQIAIVSLPRDSYIPNPAYAGAKDKLTHLGLKGVTNTMAGLSDYLDQNIDNYVLVNFTAFRNIIDALGGITIDNPYSFTSDLFGGYYPEGQLTLDGDEALIYVRERYNLPRGDFDRNLHQQIVMKAIIAKLSAIGIITRFDALMSALEGNFLTNLSASAFYGLCRKQLDEGIEWNIVNYHVTGSLGMEICASAPGQELSVVYPYENQVEFVSEVIGAVIAGEILEQEDMPEGE